MSHSIPRSTAESNYNRSCDSCRHHKVRCCPGELENSKVCQRCEKMGRSCVFTAPQKRKQRKRTDTRVAELEREVLAMRALFDHAPKQAKGESRHDSGTEMDYYVENSIRPSPPGQAYEAGSISTSNSSPRANPEHPPIWNPDLASSDSDVIDRGIISIDQAEKLLRIYNEDVVNNYLPVVVLSPNVTAEELRRSKPTLFLAVIAAAAGKVSPTLLSILNSEALAAYAYRTVVGSEKSLELVQAMMISCIWYKPPGKFSKLKFYEYIHMAVTMAIDLGYGTNPRSSRSRGTIKPAILSDQDVEQRRVFLLCYVISLTAAMTLRRPNLLRYNGWLDQCAETLANLPNQSVHDAVIVAWVRLSKISEDIHTSLSYDDMGSVLNLSDSRTQMMVSGFEKALEGWRKNVESINSKSLFMAYHHSQIFLHEVSLHDDHPPEHFRPPFSPENIFTLNMDPMAKCTHIEATSACVCHAQSLLDILLSMSVGELRSTPVYAYVRMLYAVNILTKIHISSKSPSSKVGTLIDTNSIRLGFYLEALIKKLVEAAGPMECRSPLVFLGLLQWIRIWYKGQVNDEFFAPPTNLPPRPEACAIPPVSHQALAEDKFMNSHLNPTIAAENMDIPAPEQNYHNFDLEQEFEPFELIGLDPSFNALNADMNILPILDEDFMPPNFDWGFPPAMMNFGP